MKTFAYYFIASLFALLIIQGCKKNADLAAVTGQRLSATKTTLKINEPDSLSLAGTSSSNAINWSVTPSGFDVLLVKNNIATISFTKSGLYTLTVTENGTSPIVRSIKVNDSVYKPVIQYITVPLTGDQITLVPSFYKSAVSDSTFLTIVAQTKNSYCGTGTLETTHNIDNAGNYSIGFLNVVQSSICGIGDNPIASVINFTQNQPNPLPNGTFPLSVTLNGTTYTGSIVVTSSTITFNWEYTSGVLISPKQISR